MELGKVFVLKNSMRFKTLKSAPIIESDPQLNTIHCATHVCANFFFHCSWLFLWFCILFGPYFFFFLHDCTVFCELHIFAWKLTHEKRKFIFLVFALDYNQKNPFSCEIMIIVKAPMIQFPAIICPQLLLGHKTHLELTTKNFILYGTKSFSVG